MTTLLFMRDITLAFRRGGGTFAALAFCLICFALFAFSLGPEALHTNAARLTSVLLLLSLMLSLPQLFERDNDDGSLEQYLVQPVALEWLVLAKLIAFWCVSGLPLALFCPLMGLMAGLDMQSVLQLLAAMLLATPTLCALGMLGAALTLGARKGGLAQTLILLPLYIPTLIFAAAAGAGDASLAPLIGFALMSVPLSCLLTAPLLRLTVD